MQELQAYFPEGKAILKSSTDWLYSKQAVYKTLYLNHLPSYRTNSGDLKYDFLILRGKVHTDDTSQPLKQSGRQKDILL